MTTWTRIAAAATVAFASFSGIARQGAAQGASSARPERVVHDSLRIGGLTIDKGEVVSGPVVTAGGDINVFGTVQGSAFAIAGDVIVHPGGRITGDAIAAFGDINVDSGEVSGNARALTGLFGASVRSIFEGDEAVAQPTRSPLSLSLAWFGVMMLIGLGVFVFASPYLEGVADVLGQSFWKSFLTGIAGELGVLPVIFLVSIGLAVTVLGVLLIPFAIVAVILAVAGLATLGFVAVARITGDGLGGNRAAALSSKGSALRALLLGLSLYMGLWVAATALGSLPLLGVALRLVAVLVTFVAVTTGFGAALLSRGGTRRDAAVTVVPAPAMDATGWQTPTPVAGVVAATRRTPTPRAGAR